MLECCSIWLLAFSSSYSVWCVYIQITSSSQVRKQQSCDCTETMIHIIRTLHNESQLFSFYFPGWIRPLNCFAFYSVYARNYFFQCFYTCLTRQVWLNESCMSAVDSKHAHVLKEIVIRSDMCPAQQPAVQLSGA